MSDKVQANIDRQEEKDLARRWRESSDSAAFDSLVGAHMGLVVHLAQDMARDLISLEDLIQEGNIGLTLAARRFDERRGVRLATYATHWIRAYMMKYILRSYGPVRMDTTHRRRKIFFNLGRARKQIQALGDDLDIKLLAEEIGVPLHDAEEIVPYIVLGSVSLDSPESVDNAKGAVEKVMRAETSNPEELLGVVDEQEFVVRTVRSVIDSLPAKEKTVIELRYLTDGKYGTFRDIGKMMNLSAERVRQIELRARKRVQKRLRAAGLDQ
jgi:RNA polymerase sigma-32 factor